jgi:hypothetical protein
MKTIFSILIFITSLSWQGLVLADNGGPSDGRISTVTRLVFVFTQLENELSKAIAAKDVKATSQLLMNNFEELVGTDLDNPIPKGDWMEEAMKLPPSETRMENMSVHGYDKLAVVSYLLKQTNLKRGGPPDVYIVDVWVQSQDNWKLSVRYADVPDSKLKVPGIPKRVYFEKKY